MVVTFNTIDFLFKQEWWADAVALYMFYYKQVKHQQRQFESDIPDQIYLCKSTDSFCMKWLWFGRSRFRKAKKILQKHNLIEKVIVRDWNRNKSFLIQVKYIGFSCSPKSYTVEKCTSSNGATNTQETKYINTQETIKENTGDFEKLRKHYPHARKWKKKDSKQFVQESWYTMQEYYHWLRLLNWEIIFWMQDPKYIPAAERWFRDFVPIPKHIEEQKLRQMYLIFKSSSTLQEKHREEFVRDWWLERLQNLRKEIRLEEQEVFIQSVKNAK